MFQQYLYTQQDQNHTSGCLGLLFKAAAKEIANLKIPVLIMQGDKDIQVGVKEAQKLYMARIFSSFYIIENMNHVLKHCDSDNTLVQLETYKNPDLPIKSELIEHITRFIRQ